VLLLQFLMFQNSLMQVVDFHDSFTYFSHVLTLGERDQPGKRASLMLFRPLGRRGVRLASCSGRKGRTRDVFGETPNTAVGQSKQHKSGPLSGLTALPMNRISKHSRLFESIRGSILPFSKVRIQLLQVDDFHDRFRLFSYGLVPGLGQSSARRFFCDAKNDRHSGSKRSPCRAFPNRKRASDGTRHGGKSERQIFPKIEVSLWNIYELKFQPRLPMEYGVVVKKLGYPARI
jgi:hypothetical protein